MNVYTIFSKRLHTSLKPFFANSDEQAKVLFKETLNFFNVTDEISLYKIGYYDKDKMKITHNFKKFLQKEELKYKEVKNESIQ